MTDIEHIAAFLTVHEKRGQLAEEASELSQAALKMQRLFMPMNKPRKTYAECVDNVYEEIADILVCLDVLGISHSADEINRIRREKEQRWARGIRRKTPMKEPKPVGICACDYCGEAIEDGEEHYELPGGERLHEDCLFDWARAFRKIEWSDD